MPSRRREVEIDRVEREDYMTIDDGMDPTPTMQS